MKLLLDQIYESHIMTQIHQRDSLYIKFKETGDQNSLILYKNYRNNLVSEVRKAKSQFDCHINNELCKNEHSSISWWKVCTHDLTCRYLKNFAQSRCKQSP